MENIKWLSDDVAITCKQPSFEEFQRFAEAGFSSVLNLRAAGEPGSLENESQQVRRAGLHYSNVLLEAESPSNAAMDSVLKMLKILPKPVLCHCKSGFCAGFVVLTYDARACCLSAEEALAKGEAAGLHYRDHPHIKQFISDYISKR